MNVTTTDAPGVVEQIVVITRETLATLDTLTAALRLVAGLPRADRHRLADAIYSRNSGGLHGYADAESLRGLAQEAAEYLDDLADGAAGDEDDSTIVTDAWATSTRHIGDPDCDPCPGHPLPA